MSSYVCLSVKGNKVTRLKLFSKNMSAANRGRGVKMFLVSKYL